MKMIALSPYFFVLLFSGKVFYAQADADHHAEAITINPAIAQQSGISTAPAGAGEIHQTLSLYGRVVADADSVSHIRARFPGTLVKVNAKLGERVNKGDVLAEVESNDSLRRYQLTAPLSGIVSERHASVGESTGAQVLFTVANFDQLWAELRIFPSQMAAAKVGQAVSLKLGDAQLSTQLTHIIPGVNDQAFVLARAAIDNRSALWAPGMLVAAELSISRQTLPLVVDNLALQSIAGQTLVFVKEGNKYEARPLTLGRSDSHYSEVLAGLSVGENYVLTNSYVLKADLQKSGAEHQH
ncbi:efflux RND transporter periplasmic adaptor subunit [Dasania sp. GY-MA-18]|uniref:Efflux RND transporter periplasmic adaptor subunit n=1 Tax=Dasania phycosphaerae TaxID=2950436 RepID=A0A9J6RKW3_9GAMM|nr:MULTISPECIES: efflux RND transporter periplasmic adaptor subunit [Dasania]MCR8922630.1 efflux RND transporter periplasmic adaptor subunit [Dasania sp. GY-MA-18]MCZ0865060.1 efflux RND transporter periplasmic adaptor subunit [Dasania phycosphaerae]MCZ0868786.1 efflux RND transporter periplasmic adaptor subunit [Dasania phycosphaerae]